MGGRRWTVEEEAVLKEVAGSDVTLLSQMHRLPGRDWNAAKCRACKLGLKLTNHVAWTEEERAILREIWASKSSIKAGMKRLPNRNYDAARSEAQRLGILGKRGTAGRTGYAFVQPAIVSALENESPLSAERIASITGATLRQVHKVLKSEHSTIFRIDGYMRKSTFGDPAALWALGSDPDASRPEPKAARLSRRDYNERKRVASGRFDPFASLMKQVAA
ncbi:hypothetical protein PQQ84_05640 [Paraburkholderia strydomiana]|uniref:hypothetical protein n=1 Tax=Paraburkholderia strydomiana TaxID=1245417 RepID=UPI0038B90BCA